MSIPAGLVRHLSAQSTPAQEDVMSDGPSSYPADAGSATYLLTVRGKVTTPTVEGAREIHNGTAGSPEGVAAARALGDLSHNVYSAAGSANGEILFIDYWNSLTGLGQFFADAQVQAGASQLFTERDGVVWAQTNGFGNFHLASPSGASAVGVGLIRVGVSSLEAAAPAFDAYVATTINTARSYGQLAHTTWSRVANPGESTAPEILGVDLWSDVDQMNAYYELGLGFDHLGPVFTGQPQTSVWQQAAGDWTEW
jgi:hypothetical protein